MLNLFLANFRSLVSPNNIWNLDELIFPHSTLRDPLVAFIPRKPHPLGIVAYLAAVKLSFTGLPIIMWIMPVTSLHGLSGPHAFQAFLTQIQGTFCFKIYVSLHLDILCPLPKNDLHVVVDALFPTKETIATASSQNIGVTWSQNSHHKKSVMTVLSDGLLEKEWEMVCWINTYLFIMIQNC